MITYWCICTTDMEDVLSFGPQKEKMFLDIADAETYSKTELSSFKVSRAAPGGPWQEQL